MMGSVMYDAFRDATMGNLRAESVWMAVPKKGWRRLVARLLRHPADKWIWIGSVTADGQPSVTIAFTSSGLISDVSVTSPSD